MRPITRLIVLLCSVVIVVQAFALCAATGWRALTHFPQEEIRQSSESKGLDTLFSGTGLNDGNSPTPRLANQFTFGLLPTPGFTPEAISVTTTAGPALLMGLLALVPRRRRRGE
jgi:hypothetical protein